MRFIHELPARKILNIDRSVYVAIMFCLALWTLPFTNAKGHLLTNEAATRTTLTAGKEAVNFDHLLTPPNGFVFEHRNEGAKRSVRQVLCQFRSGVR